MAKLCVGQIRDLARQFEVNPEQPDFEIRVRAQRFSPDMFYVNEFAERLFQLDASVFNQLFG